MKLNTIVMNFALNASIILAVNHGHHINHGDSSINVQVAVDINSSEAENFYNSENGPCNEEFWTKKLAGTKRNGKLFEKDGKSIGEIKHKYVLGDCEPMTKIFDIDRLAFYFNDDKCIEFKRAACN